MGAQAVTEEEAIALLRSLGYQVCRWRLTGDKDAHFGPTEGRGSERTLGLWWVDGKRYTLDGLQPPAP